MFDFLIQLDQQWLVAINSWNAPWADTLMWIASGKLTWLPLYLLLIALLFWRYDWKKALFLCAAIGVAVGGADFISSGIIKHLVCRPRPTHEPALEGLLHIVNGYKGGMYGFVSSHAANTIACALLFCLAYTHRLKQLKVSHLCVRLSVLWTTLMLWTALNCYSRMYLGVHYPGDIIGGLIVGASVAIIIWLIVKRFLAIEPSHYIVTPNAQTQNILFIANRLYYSYQKANRTSRPAVRIALAGIVIGVMIMIITISVVVGFKRVVAEKTALFGGHIQVTRYDDNSTFERQPIEVTDSLLTLVRQQPHVKTANTFLTKPGILKTDEDFQGIVLKAIDIDTAQTTVHPFASNLTAGRMPQKENEVVLSESLCRRLQLQLGDEVYCYFVGDDVRVRKWKVEGIYTTGFGEADNLFVWCQPKVIRRLNGWRDSQAGGIEVTVDKLKYLDRATQSVWQATGNRFYEDGESLYTRNLEQLNPQIFSWLDLLDMNVVVIVLLMLAVTGFNIISALIILILDSINLIGTLKALGANNTFLRRIFLTEASMLIVRGIVWGNVFGLTLAAIQYVTHMIPLDPASYYVNFVPMAFPWGWFAVLNIGVIAVAVLIMLAPSSIATRISPAQVMRYD
ncbi:MAG: phosphatase PAP2 family protein [Paludibacteraceae bacterium]|nr:phosphatase PAP2 family protein [Paludibacteraceae bacterium]